MFILLGSALCSAVLAVELRGLPIELAPGAADSKLAPRFSPKGTQITLAPKAMPGLPGVDHLEGRIKLGPARDKADGGQLFALARSAKGKPYDTLILDADRDGALAGEAKIVVDSSAVRGKIWSTFAAAPQVDHAARGAPAWEEYPVSLWVVVEKPEEVPSVIRYSRRGFLTGTVAIGGKAHVVLLADGNNDGVFGPGDSWTVRAADAAGAFTADESRAVGDFAWAAGAAWKLVLEGTAGRKARLVRFDPGTTRAEDAARRDRLREDREAPRAENPVAFRNDADAAIKEAGEKKRPYFLKFETDWCVPCKQMHALVFTSKAVAEASDGVTCIVVDGDARKDLVEKHKVNGYPTGILFGPNGAEVARFSGYRGVKETTEFFGKLKK